MFRKAPILAVSVLAVGVAVALAVPKNDSGKPAAAASTAGPTVGDFLVQYAATMGLAGESGKPQDARGALRKAGVIGDESIDLSSPLTEGDVVRLSGKQLRITTNNPGRSYTQEKMSEFFGVFAPDIRQLGRGRSEAGALKGGTVPGAIAVTVCPDPPCPGGKGKGKGKGGSPNEP